MKRLIAILIPLALLGGLGGLVNKKVQEKKKVAAEGAAQREARKKMPASVTLAAAEVRDVVRTFESVASVEAPLNVKLAPEMTARILSIAVQEGDRVSQGQVLVRLDASELQAQLLQRQAQVAEEKQRLAQAQFSEEPTNAQVTSDIRQQEAAVATAKARYDQAVESDKSQVAAAQASVSEMQSRVNSAGAAIENAEAAMRSAQASLDNARSSFKRLDGLLKQGYIAAQDVDNSRTAVSVQQANLEVAQGQLKSAKSAREGALQQKESAQQQLETARSKGRADVEAARAAMSQALASLAVAKANTVRKPAFRRSLAVQQAAIDAAQAGVTNVKALLQNTEIRSPITGFVTARNMDPGAMGSPGQPILVLQAIDQVWVNLPVPEEVNRSIHFGQSGTVTFDALPGRTFTGKVSMVNAAADPVTRQFPVRITLDNRDGAVKPGMFGRVDLELERVKKAVVVPPEAVQTRKGETCVVVAEETQTAEGPSLTARLRPVKTGASDAQGVAIIEGVQAGEKVVVMSAMPVKDGQALVEGGKGGKGGGRGGKGGPGAEGRGGKGGPGGEGRGGAGAEGQGGPGSGRPAEGNPGGAGASGSGAEGRPGSGEGRPGAGGSEGPAGSGKSAGGRGERGAAGHPRGAGQAEGANGKP